MQKKIFLFLSIFLTIFFVPKIVYGVSGEEVFFETVATSGTYTISPTAIPCEISPSEYRVEFEAVNHEVLSGSNRGSGAGTCSDGYLVLSSTIGSSLETFVESNQNGVYDFWFYVSETSDYPTIPDYYLTATRTAGEWTALNQCQADLPSSSAERCNCTLPTFPQPSYCGECLWDYNSSTCLSINAEIFVPAHLECLGITEQNSCEAVSYCRWADDACGYYRPLPADLETTDPDFGIVGNAIRDLFKWAFIPDEDVGIQWRILQNTIAGKMPFGYYYLIRDKIQGISYSEEEMPVVSTTFLGSSITIFNFASVSAFSATSWDFLQKLIAIGLWFGLLFYLFSRIKELQL